MPIEVRWDEGYERVVRWEMTGKITSEDFWQAQDETFALIDPVKERTDLIVHTDPRLQLPPGFMSTLGASDKRIQRRTPQNAASLIIVVGEGAFTKAFMTLFLKLHPIERWETAGTIEAAYTRIAADRAEK